MDQIKKWGDSIIWNIIESYPGYMKNFFFELRSALHEYLIEPTSSEVLKNFPFKVDFLDKFHYFLSKTEDLELSFAKAGGLTTSIGFLWAQYQIITYFEIYQQLPAIKHPLFKAIASYVNSGCFRLRAIKRWRDFKETTLKQYILRNFDAQYLWNTQDIERTSTIILHMCHQILGFK